jgi:hypothetical protein
VWDEKTAEVHLELVRIAAEAETIAKKYKPRAEKFAREFGIAMAPLRRRLALATQAVTEKAENLQVELPDRPVAGIAGTDESGWLFDSNREYLDQIRAYAARKNGHGQ